MIGSDAKNIALASPAKRPFNCANALDAIGGDKGERHRSGNGPFDHANHQGRLGCEGRFLRNMFIHVTGHRPTTAGQPDPSDSILRPFSTDAMLSAH